MTYPEVTVLMSVYNGEQYLYEAIQSVLNQTFKNFEFLIIDDASNDSSAEIINCFNDNRIRYLRNPENLGLTLSLNKGILLSNGKYIARMDADDICLPTRLEKQLMFMNEHPECGVLGTWFEYLPSGRIAKPPIVHEEIYARLFKENVIAHSSAFIKRDILIDNQFFYNTDYKKAQDYELWSRLIEVTKFSNLPEILILYREHKNQISNCCRTEQLAFDIEVKVHLYKRVLGNLINNEFSQCLTKMITSGSKLTNNEFRILILHFEKALFNVKKSTSISTEAFLLIHTLLLKKAFDNTCKRSITLLPFIIKSTYFWNSTNGVKAAYLHKIVKDLFAL